MTWGLCSCCCAHQEEHDLNDEKPKQEKIRPLLADLDEQFKEACGSDNRLNKEELATIWKKVASTKVGKLSAEDEKLIDQSVAVFFKQMDFQADGAVTYEEFVAYMMGIDEARGGLAVDSFRRDMNRAVKKNPELLSGLIDKFKTWDKNGDGKVTPDELDAALKDMHDSHASRSDIDQLRKLKNDIFAQADLDGNGYVDLWEVMAYMLGRRKQPVEVLMYDVSKGFAAKWTPVLMGKKVQAVHTGVLVYNSEYWCGGKIYRSEPPCTKCFGEPLKEYSPTEPLRSSIQRPDLPVIFIGYTFVTHDEFAAWMQKNIVPRYDREKYDLLTHSCNHFTNEAVTFLTGIPLPERIFDLQKAFLTPTVIAMRPFLNKYMCCFGDAKKAVDKETKFAEDYMPEDRQDNHQELISEVLGTGEVVHLVGLDGMENHESVLGTITAKSDGKFSVKYFDPVQEVIVEKHDVDAKHVKRL